MLIKVGVGGKALTRRLQEYRIPMPLTLEEYQRGQLFSVCEASKNETGGGEGVEIVKQEPFTSTTLRPGYTLSGTYTYKIYRLRSKIPWFYRKLLPETAMVLHEEAYNAFPYCQTTITNPGYMKDNFHIVVKSVHVANDAGGLENALEADAGTLGQREVVHLDILDSSVLKPTASGRSFPLIPSFLSLQDVTPQTDPLTFASAASKRGPLRAGWTGSGEFPVMCAYKLVTAHFKWFGLQTKVEKNIHSNYPRLFVKFHRELWCWQDKWFGLTLENIRQLEAETVNVLRKQQSQGAVRGMAADEAP
ncbi:Phosphatidylinositol transfer protein domain containing protein [Aphelenchoides fujianensis]|nr:Phosphatidylinositol transfer protein domain containing protein [Aphelenchoides fujianensis]